MEATFTSALPCSAGVKISPGNDQRPRLIPARQLDRSISACSRPPSPTGIDEKIVIVMVGLPARGKSYITKKICRYLNWLQYQTKIFNVGERRRKESKRRKSTANSDFQLSVKINSASCEENLSGTAGFFDPYDNEASKIREQLAMSTLDEALDYLIIGDGSVAIFDATNTTVKRRNMVADRIATRAGSAAQVLFLESQCFDQEILESNIRLKLSGADYKDQDPMSGLLDFKRRIEMYEKKYVPLGENEELRGYAYCQTINTVNFLQHFHLFPRSIWITAQSQPSHDIYHASGNSPQPHDYFSTLAQFMDHQKRTSSGKRGNAIHPELTTLSTWEHENKSFASAFRVWTSNTLQSKQVVRFFNPSTYQIGHRRMLFDLDSEETPESEFSCHEEHQNMPRGCSTNSKYEQYLEVTSQLNSIILEVEQLTDDVILISDLLISRILLAYFRGLRKEEIADLEVPLGTLYKLEPRPYGVIFQEFVYDPIVSWFR